MLGIKNWKNCLKVLFSTVMVCLFIYMVVDSLNKYNSKKLGISIKFEEKGLIDYPEIQFSTLIKNPQHSEEFYLNEMAQLFKYNPEINGERCDLNEDNFEEKTGLQKGNLVERVSHNLTLIKSLAVATTFRFPFPGKFGPTNSVSSRK